MDTPLASRRAALTAGLTPLLVGGVTNPGGNNVLIFDWRSRGESDVAQHSLAYYELRDAEAALRYALGRHDNQSLLQVYAHLSTRG